ncbi:uncharacterized protein EV422DRAFT_533645 [Fimicolochytrium jonesii]|uniref:uncharacterized protein n=1 Tax=Fimicolochytrium jonesii TaxID=1396493 RepID=UPI0022FE0AE8|nr:uncharacterized protein EV422DRAFT_533645 [Fimicolochytrium jonesii]KAI8819614.1 hypothetical protein EV422DRAFT_533645 [Fimicolochytrium jonesii]
MKLTERERPTVGWHLPPEIWTQIFTLIVREEIARMSRKLCEKDFNRRTKTTFRELPACYVLSRVCRNWHGTVRDLVENAKWTRFHYAAFWNDGQDEPFFFPQGPITLDKVENLQLTTGSSHVEQLLSMVPNVRRLIFSKTPPNAFFEAASKHCPAVHHITQSQDELFPSPQLDPGVLKTALSRWHSAGFGGVRQLELDSDLVVDDDLLTSIM